MEHLERELAPVERDIWYWVEHVAHWYLLLFALVASLAIGTVLFDRNATSWAATVLPYEIQK